jgi:hypothetical protein
MRISEIQFNCGEVESEVWLWQTIAESYFINKAAGYLFESDEDLEKYSKFVLKYQKYLTSNINAKIGKKYAAVNIISLASRKQLIIAETTDAYELIEKSLNRLHFKRSDGSEVSYPAIQKMGNDAFIFSSLQKKNNFILDLKLKFSDWNLIVKDH